MSWASFTSAHGNRKRRRPPAGCCWRLVSCWAALVGPSSVVVGELETTAPSSPSWLPRTYIEPVTVLQCRLGEFSSRSGFCDALAQDAERLYGAASERSLQGFVDVLCSPEAEADERDRTRGATGGYLRPSTPLCRDRQGTLEVLGELQPLSVVVQLGDGAAVTLTLGPSEAPLPALTGQCEAQRLPPDLCLQAIRSATGRRLCALHPLRAEYHQAPRRLEAPGLGGSHRLSLALQHLCEDDYRHRAWPQLVQGALDGLRLQLLSPRDDDTSTVLRGGAAYYDLPVSLSLTAPLPAALPLPRPMNITTSSPPAVRCRLCAVLDDRAVPHGDACCCLDMTGLQAVQGSLRVAGGADDRGPGEEEADPQEERRVELRVECGAGGGTGKASRAVVLWRSYRRVHVLAVASSEQEAERGWNVSRVVAMPELSSEWAAGSAHAATGQVASE